MPELALAHLRFWADSCEFAAAAFGKMSFYDPAEHLDHGAYVAFALMRSSDVGTFALNKVRSCPLTRLARGSRQLLVPF